MNSSNYINLISPSSNWYRRVFYDLADPRIRDFIFFGDPVPVVACFLFYIILCRVIIPMAMKDREPLKLKMFSWLMKNAVFGISLYFLIAFGEIWMNYSWRCEPLDKSMSESTMEAINLVYYYFMAKFVYTLESLIVAFRKDTSLTRDYLLIHHTMLPLSIWLTINYFPTGHATFAVLITSAAHAVFFGFKLICENNFVNLRWLYKYAGTLGTTQTIFQFLAIFGHAAQLFIWNDCNYPIASAYIICGSIIVFLTIMAAVLIPQASRFRGKIEFSTENSP